MEPSLPFPLAPTRTNQFCTGCGSQVSGAKFCGACGTPVAQPSLADDIEQAEIELTAHTTQPLEAVVLDDALARIKENFTPADVAEAAKALLARLIEEDKLHPNSASGKRVYQLEGDEKDYDKTQLSMIQGMNLMRIHRDYLAHAARYEFLLQRVKNSGASAMVLDIGCADVPLMRAIRSSMLSPKLYFGMDIRPYEVQKVLRYYSTHHVHFPFQVEYGDITEAGDELLNQPWTQVVCMEVLEHMPKARGQMLLTNLAKTVAQGGDCYLSTPCFDGKSKALHHKYEWSHDELQAELESKFNIEAQWGTFASVRHLYRVLTPEEKVVWDGLDQRKGGYWGNIALSLIFAPLHPEISRNCMWNLRSKA